MILVLDFKLCKTICYYVSLFKFFLKINVHYQYKIVAEKRILIQVDFQIETVKMKY